MTKKCWRDRVVLWGCIALLAAWGGCSKEEATKTLKKAEEAAEGTAESVAKEAGKVVEKGEQVASELGEKALAYLNPLKEKFANLKSLKESPEELKQAVTDLIQEIEGKAEDLQLPEKMSSALATVKEKLVALKDYLEGEIDQTRISEHIQGIVDTVKSELGMTEK